MLSQSSWRTTDNLNLAAALMVCGVKVLPIRMTDEPSGKALTQYDLWPSGHCPASVIPAEDPDRIRERFHLGPLNDSPALAIATGPLRRILESGEIDQADPTHPAWDALKVLHARECILTFANRGTRYRIQVHPHAPRAHLVEGQDPLAQRLRTRGFEVWKTRDTALAAAMSRIGCPVLDILGEKPHREYILPRFGHPLGLTRSQPEDAFAIARALLLGTLLKHCPEHPCLWGYYACKARTMLLQTIENKGAHSQVYLHYDRTTAWQRRRRSAVVEERAPNAALDQAMRHLKG